MQTVTILEFLTAVFGLLVVIVPMIYAFRCWWKNRARRQPADVEMGAPAQEARLQNPTEGVRPQHVAQNGVEEATARERPEEATARERPQNGVEEATARERPQNVAQNGVEEATTEERPQHVAQNYNYFQCFNFCCSGTNPGR